MGASPFSTTIVWHTASQRRLNGASSTLISAEEMTQKARQNRQFSLAATILNDEDLRNRRESPAGPDGKPHLAMGAGSWLDLFLHARDRDVGTSLFALDVAARLYCDGRFAVARIGGERAATNWLVPGQERSQLRRRHSRGRFGCVTMLHTRRSIIWNVRR